MKIFIRYILLFFILIASMNGYSQNWKLALDLVITEEGRAIPAAEINILKNGSHFEKKFANAKGQVVLDLEPGAVYTIEVGGSDNYIKKKLEVNTNNVPAEALNGNIKFPAAVDIFKKLEGLDYAVLNQPIGKIIYNPKKETFEVDEAYTSRMQAQLQKLERDFIAEKKRVEAEYKLVIRDADRAYKKEEWQEAEGLYLKAKALMPSESYPDFQLAELKTKLIAINKDQQYYDAAIKDGDKAFAQENFQLATASYERALKYKPREQYPQDKLKEIKETIANQAKIEQQYIAAVEAGDNALKIREYKTAKASFEKATELKPKEQYPKNKLAEINDVLAKQEVKEQEYKDAIAKGDEAFKAKDYPLAKSSYEKAKGVKPTEKYPQDQIAKVEELMAAAAKLDQQYLAAIEVGDNALKSKEYQKAIKSFEEASALKPAEEYPKNKIKEINSILEKEKELEKQYNEQIALADKAFEGKSYESAKQGYESALKLKPAEKYPKDQIAKVEAALGELAKQEENYNAAIAKGDKALAAEDYEVAKSAFQEALSIKADEKYPKDKLAEIETIVISIQKNLAAYEETIQKADQALAKKEYEASKKLYESALSIKADEKYPKDKITEIDGLLAKIAETNASYQAAIDKGDKAKQADKLEEAIAAYEEALSIKSDEAYPKEQIAGIKDILEKKKALEENYNAAIAKGDKAFGEENYQDALKAFEEALALKKDEAYPQERIQAINSLLAEKQQADASYQAAIDKGDKAKQADKLEEAIAAYEEALSIKSDEVYPKEQIAGIKDILEKRKALEENYNAAIAKGDQSYGAEEYQEAISSYQEALSLKNDEAYPKKQIEVIKEILAKQEAADANYQEAIAKADAAFGSEEWASAKSAYEEALKIKDDEYPKGKIKEVEAKLAEIAANEEKAAQLEAEYQQAIAKGDASLSAKELDAAITAYQEALALKPNESYPQDKITEIEAEKKRLAEEEAKAQELAKLEAEYKELITNADQAFSVQNYEEARTAYQSALALKAEENYPKSKIEEIDKILGDAEKQEAAYKELIATADNLFNEEDWTAAKNKYTEATTIKTEEQYPKDRIAQIDEKLAEIAAKEEEIRLQNAKEAELDAQYQGLIAEADASFESEEYEAAKSKYQSALEIKDESYPKNQISLIEERLAALAAASAEEAEQARIDAEYQGLVAEADASFESEEYEAAKSKYQSALAVKDESYPKNQISLIEERLAALELASEEQAKIDAEYQGLIAEADASFESEEYEVAKSKYQSALAVKDESYPKNQISLIEERLSALAAASAEEAEQAKIDAEYQGLIAEADASFESGMFDEAITKYQAALEVKNETYPREQITRIQEQMATIALQREEEELAAREAKREAEYQAFIAKGDAFLEEGKLAEAREEYISAIGIKEDNYPAMKIADIDEQLKALAAADAEREKQAQLDAAYQEAIKNADLAFSERNYPVAIGNYEEALRIKSEESYPKTKIAEIENLMAEAAKEAAKEDSKYQELIAVADEVFEGGELERAKAIYLDALTVKPNEPYPTNKVKEIDDVLNQLAQREEEIRLERERAAQREEEYHKSIAKADQLFEVSNYEGALVEYRNAQELMPSEDYPNKQIAKINQVFAQRQKEMDEAARKQEEEERYHAHIAAADDAYKSKKYHLAASKYSAASRLKRNEAYPKSQLEKVLAIIEEQKRLARAERKLTDEPIKIQEGPRASIDKSAEEDIDRMYQEMWAKNKQSKVDEVEAKQKSLADLQDAQREKEHQKRQEALANIEAIAISIQAEQKESQQLNLQNYEEVLNQEDALRTAKITNERESQNRRHEAFSSSLELEADIINYKKEQEKKQEVFSEEIAAQHRVESQLKEDRERGQQERIGVSKTKVEEHVEVIDEFKQRRSQEQLETTTSNLKEIEDDWQNTKEGYVYASKERRGDNYDQVEEQQKAVNDFHGGRATSYKKFQEKVEDVAHNYKEFHDVNVELAHHRIIGNKQKNEELLASLQNQSAHKNTYHKDGQLRVEEQQLAWEEEKKALEEASKERRLNNSEREFYKGEKKIRENREAADYPQGITEKVIEGTTSTTIRRIVVNGTQVDVYEKTLYQYGGIYYSKNGASITQDTWDKESVE